jgi:hypothetical protein
VPGSVRITEEALKKGRKAVLTYVMRWGPDDRGGIALEWTAVGSRTGAVALGFRWLLRPLSGPAPQSDLP